MVTSAVIARAAEVMAYLHGFDNVTAINLIGCFDSATIRPTRAASTRVPLSRRIQQQALVPGSPPAWATTPEEYTDFVLRATGLWISSGMWQDVTLSPAVAVIRRLRGLDVRNCHFSNRKSDHLFTVYPDGCVEQLRRASLARRPVHRPGRHAQLA